MKQKNCVLVSAILDAEIESPIYVILSEKQYKQATKDYDSMIDFLTYDDDVWKTKVDTLAELFKKIKRNNLKIVKEVFERAF